MTKGLTTSQGVNTDSKGFKVVGFSTTCEELARADAKGLSGRERLCRGWRREITIL